MIGRKGAPNDIAWIITSAVIMISVFIVIGFFLTGRVAVQSDFPETSAKIGSYSILQNVISQNCLGTNTSGIIEEDKITDSQKLNCINYPSFSYYIRLEYDDEEKIYTDLEVVDYPYSYFNTFSSRFVIPVIIKKDEESVSGNMTLITVYKTEEPLVLFRSCVEEAWLQGECRVTYFKKTQSLDTIHVFEESKICETGVTYVESSNRNSPTPTREEYEICMNVEGEFKERYEEDFDTGLNEKELIIMKEDGKLVVLSD